MLIIILFANFIVSIISFIGALFLRQVTTKQERIGWYLVSFAAGILIAAAFLNILPEALERLDISTGLTWALGGIIAAFLMERLLVWYHHHHHAHDIKPTAFLVLFGDGVHNFIDGLAIAASFSLDPQLGVATTFAIAAHEIPQELADYTVLVHSGMTPYKALVYNFASALTALAGGFFGYYFFQTPTDLVYVALALTAGLFIYIASADLIPELHSENSRQGWLGQTVLFLLGIAVMYTIGLYVHE